MRLIAGGDTYSKFEKTKEYLSELGEGIVLFAEGSFRSDDRDWTLDQLAEYTRDLPMTIIGEKNARIHIVKEGIITPAQFYSEWGIPQSSESPYREADHLHDVSYKPGRPIMALSRICADAPTSHEGEGKADLLLIATCALDWEEEGIDVILEAHERNLKPDAFIVQSDYHQPNKFIYSVKDKKMVGEEVTHKQGDTYIVHEI